MADEAGAPQDITLIADGLRRALDDLDLYSDLVTQTLLTALPAHLVTVRRERGLAGRLRGREGVVRALSVEVGGRRYGLERARGAAPRATIALASGGIVLQTKDIGLAEWCVAVTTALAEQARTDVGAAAALESMRSLAPGTNPF